jgi:hypothetical protein
MDQTKKASATLAIEVADCREHRKLLKLWRTYDSQPKAIIWVIGAIMARWRAET